MWLFEELEFEELEEFCLLADGGRAVLLVEDEVVVSAGTGDGGVETEVVGEGAGPVPVPLAFPSEGGETFVEGELSFSFELLLLKIVLGKVPFPILKLDVGGGTTFADGVDRLEVGGVDLVGGTFVGTAESLEGCLWNPPAGEEALEDDEPPPAGESARCFIEEEEEAAMTAVRACEEDLEVGADSISTALLAQRDLVISHLLGPALKEGTAQRTSFLRVPFQPILFLT